MDSSMIERWLKAALYGMILLNKPSTSKTGVNSVRTGPMSTAANFECPGGRALPRTGSGRPAGRAGEMEHSPPRKNI